MFSLLSKNFFSELFSNRHLILSFVCYKIHVQFVIAKDWKAKLQKIFKGFEGKKVICV